MLNFNVEMLNLCKIPKISKNTTKVLKNTPFLSLFGKSVLSDFL